MREGERNYSIFHNFSDEKSLPFSRFASEKTRKIQYVRREELKMDGVLEMSWRSREGPIETLRLSIVAAAEIIDGLNGRTVRHRLVTGFLLLIC